jgi:transposase
MENPINYEALLNLPFLKIQEVILEPKKIIVHCSVDTLSGKCPNCKSDCTAINQYYERTLRDLDISYREVYLYVKIRQFICKKCNKFFSETLDFADANKSHTYRQTDFMFLVGSKQSYSESAVILNTNPKTVERIILEECEKRADISARYAKVKRLGIDEQSHQKGKSNYICVLTDLDNGTIVDILKSRKKDYLTTHFEALGEDFRKQITDITCDCWQAYISLGETFFPQANIILDRFHVIKLLNICLDNFRKELRKKFPENTQYKKIKWILYKQYHMLSDKELDELHLAFEQSPALKELYFIREKFNHILDNNSDLKIAIEQIDKWMKDIEDTKITTFETFIKTLKSAKTYIANYVRDKLSNAVTEGLNNLIRSVRRTAFGMPNFENLRWRSLAIST